MHIHTHTYHPLYVKALDSPQTVRHHVCAIERLSLPLISRFAASSSRLPIRALPVEESTGLVIQRTVGSPKNLNLLGVGILGGMQNRQMKLVLWAVAELARLGTVAAIGIRLRLVRKESLQEESSPAPNTVRPLKDFNSVCQCIPSFQQGCKRKMSDFNAPASCSIRAIFRTKLGSGRLLLVEYWDHADDNPASRFRAHIVMNTAQRHCRATYQCV